MKFEKREPTRKEIRYRIIRKLARHRIIGGKHTSIENIPKGMPKDLRKTVLEEVKQLIREGIIIAHPTSYGMQVSLNPRKIKEIKEILEEEI